MHSARRRHREELRRLKHAILNAELALRGGGGGKERDLPGRRFYNEARRRLLRGGMTKEERDALMARVRKEAAEKYARMKAQRGAEDEEEEGEGPDDDDAMEGPEQGGQGPTKRRRLDMEECPICFEKVLPKLPDGERDPDPVLVGSPATGMRPAEPHSRAPITLHMASKGEGGGEMAHRACQACVTGHFDTADAAHARAKCPVCQYAFIQADYDRLGREYLPAVSDAESSDDDDDVSDAESSDDDDDAPIPLGEGAAPIHHAAARGDREEVRRLLEQEGTDVDGVEPSRGRTALFLAAQNGHDGVVQDLIGWPYEDYWDEEGNPTVEEPADIFLADHGGATPLYVAAFYGHADVVWILLGYDGESSDDRELRTTAIHRDPLTGDPRYHEKGYTPLHIAAERGHVRVVEMLLEEATHAEEVTLTDGYGGTPLWLAAREGHDRIVDMLLQHGETEYEGGGDMGIDKANVGGYTPLGIAAERGHGAVVDRLLEAGANANIDAGAGAPLHVAAEEGHILVVSSLVHDDRVDIDATRARDGATPLWIAAKRGGMPGVVRTLVEKGADRTKAAADGTTPLDIAANSYIDTVSQLVQFPRYFHEDPGSSYDDFARGSTMMLDGREFMLRVHNEDMDDDLVDTDRTSVSLTFSAMDESGDFIDVYHKRWFFRGSRAWSSDRHKHKDGFRIEDYSGDALVTREVASIPGTEEMLENWYDQSSVDPWGEGLGRGGVTEDQIRDAIDADVLIPSIEHIRKLFSEDRAKALRAIIAEIGGTPVF